MKKAILLVGGATAVITIVACVVFVFAFYAIGILPLRLHPVYCTGMELLKNDPAVMELFGSPVKDSLFVIGTTKGFRDGSEVVNLEVSISGPRARGTARIYGTKNGNGTCSISSIWIEIGHERVLEYSGSEPEKGFQPVR